jgi:1-phosphatidylinositol phosphodiesterase
LQKSRKQEKSLCSIQQFIKQSQIFIKMKTKTYKISMVSCILFMSMISCQDDELIKITEEGNKINKTSRSIQPIINLTASALPNWMRFINGNLLLSEFTIPGTHDSGALYELIGGTLNTGIRALDIRCRHINNGFNIHHGSVNQKINFNDVINACTNFLNTNPSECIIMSVKEEHTPDNNSRSFEQTFDYYVQQAPSRWLLTNTVPTLSQARGKIVLLRRFPASYTPKGMDASYGWAENTTFTIVNPQITFRIQDFFRISKNNSALKWTQITNLLAEARANTTKIMFLNYTSGYNEKTIFNIPDINDISNAINPQIDTYFTNATKGKYGSLMMDFVESSRNLKIINANNFSTNEAELPIPIPDLPQTESK